MSRATKRNTTLSQHFGMMLLLAGAIVCLKDRDFGQVILFFGILLEAIYFVLTIVDIARSEKISGTLKLLPVSLLIAGAVIADLFFSQYVFAVFISLTDLVYIWKFQTILSDTKSKYRDIESDSIDIKTPE